MTGRLLAEWFGYPDAAPEHLAQLGVTWTAAQRAGGLACARVRLTGSTWTPSETGRTAPILPAWAGDPPSIWHPVDDPVLIDMIALDPGEPCRWAYRVGEPGLILGPYDLALAEGIPITPHPSPLAWLRAGALGCVFLDQAEALCSTAAEWELAA